MSSKRLEQLNACQLTEELKKAPIVYFSLGSLEHHGLHMHCVGTGYVRLRGGKGREEDELSHRLA